MEEHSSEVKPRKPKKKRAVKPRSNGDRAVEKAEVAEEVAEVKAYQEEKVNDAKETKSRYGNFLTMVDSATEALTKYFGKADFTQEEIDKGVPQRQLKTAGAKFWCIPQDMGNLYRGAQWGFLQQNWHQKLGFSKAFLIKIRFKNRIIN